jgi:hypothetical protein
MRGLFFLEYVVYTLFSERHNKTYVGFTSDLINRFRPHDSIKNDSGGLPSPPNGETNFENLEVQILRSN